MDATQEPTTGPSLGRLVNHSSRPSAKMEVIVDEKDGPHLCLFATKAIQAGEQILYNYGIRIPFEDKV